MSALEQAATAGKAGKPGKKRILFVDDEPRILDGLRDLLRRHRRKWNMAFVGSGAEALDALAQEPFDVIVTDMRMPNMDGATLLTHVQERHPGVVRIVLSGHAELETSLRAVPVAHQYLSKPCEPKQLENVIERACSLQALVDEDALRVLVGRVDRLPPRPKVYTRLVGLLAREDVTREQVAELLEQDMAISAKLLQLVNSAFFRLSRQISTVDDAVGYLGFNMIKTLVLAAEVFKQPASMPRVEGISLESLQEHCLLAGRIAARVVPAPELRDDALMAGLLHDVGLLVLVTELPNMTREHVVAACGSGRPLHVEEQEARGVTHAEVGGYLLGLWGLPYPIIEAVTHHHEPQRVPQERFDLVAAVHVADILAQEVGFRPAAEPAVGSPAIAKGYLEALGVADRLERWREVAAKEAERARET